MKTKFCWHCGKELPVESVFCPYCMTKLIDVNTGKPIKSNKKKFIIPIVIAAVVIIFAVAGTVLFFVANSNNAQHITNYEDYIDNETNRVSFGSYSLALPENWTYDITDDGVYFYEKYNYTHEETGSTGLLCSINSTSNSVEKETSESINASLLGSKYGMNYFVYHPMGIGIIEDETAQQKYHDALNEVNDVMETFQFE